MVTSYGEVDITNKEDVLFNSVASSICGTSKRLGLDDYLNSIHRSAIHHQPPDLQKNRGIGCQEQKHERTAVRGAFDSTSYQYLPCSLSKSVW